MPSLVQSILNDKNPIDPRFAKTMYLVEATNFEKMSLWERWHEEIKWEEDSSGILLQVGEIGDRPVCTCMSWVKINGHYVLFHESTSEIVDYKQVREWFKKHCDPKLGKSDRTAKTDAMNFSHCIHAIRQLGEAKR